MDLKEQFTKTMNSITNMALATSVDNAPNVRIVSFGYDCNKEGRLFFTAFKGSTKIKEFCQNPQVSCILLPENPEEEVQIRLFGEVRESSSTLDEILEMIAPKAPQAIPFLRGCGDALALYEVVFSQAHITLGMDKPLQLHF